MGGGRLPAPGRLALRGDLLSGVGRCEMTQAPHASLRGFLHLGSRCGSAADLWSFRGCSRAQAAWLAPATATVAPASLGLGKPIKDPWLWGQSVSTKQLMSAVCWVDSRYPEVRDSTQEVKAETEPLRQGSVPAVEAACAWALPSGRALGGQRRFWYR